MNNEILQNFHQRMMPLFTPQSEKLLEGIDPQQLQRLAFRYTFSVDAMVKVSRIIENAVMANPRVADVHVSFQLMSRLLPQMDRYRDVATAARALWLYGETDIDDLDILRQPKVSLVDTGNTLLTRYWYVVAYGPGIGMSLLAEQVRALSGDDRYYEGFYTFEPEVAFQIAAILHQIFPEEVTAPTPPDELVTG